MPSDQPNATETKIIITRDRKKYIILPTQENTDSRFKEFAILNDTNVTDIGLVRKTDNILLGPNDNTLLVKNDNKFYKYITCGELTKPEPIQHSFPSLRINDIGNTDNTYGNVIISYSEPDCNRDAEKNNKK